jgi:hypothetical protein
VDAATPLVVLQDISGGTQFRRYAGGGSLNDAANWTASIDLGAMASPKLAGGPGGLFLFGSTTTYPYSVFVRKFNGTTFGAPVTVSQGTEAPLHAFQDAGGRLHAAFSRGRGPIDLTHAVSDDGVTWRWGTVDSQSDGGVGDTRIAAAPDHLGVMAWSAGVGSGEIRVAAVGPDAPAGKVSEVSARGSANRAARKFRLKLSGSVELPADVTQTDGCSGTVRVRILRGKKAIASRTVPVGADCSFTFKRTVGRSAVKRAKKLTAKLAFSGNGVLAPAKEQRSLKVKR